MQPSHTHSGISLVDVALGCCFKQARSFGEAAEIPLAREMLYSRPGPLFIHTHVSAQELNQVLPERDGVILVRNFTERLRASNLDGNSSLQSVTAPVKYQTFIGGRWRRQMAQC